MKVFIISDVDWGCCYYEGDTPTHKVWAFSSEQKAKEFAKANKLWDASTTELDPTDVMQYTTV